MIITSARCGELQNVAVGSLQRPHWRISRSSSCSASTSRTIRARGRRAYGFHQIWCSLRCFQHTRRRDRFWPAYYRISHIVTKTAITCEYVVGTGALTQRFAILDTTRRPPRGKPRFWAQPTSGTLHYTKAWRERGVGFVLRLAFRFGFGDGTSAVADDVT